MRRKKERFEEKEKNPSVLEEKIALEIEEVVVTGYVSFGVQIGSKSEIKGGEREEYIFEK